jgi:ABC-2 type transport system permease protein
MMRGIWRLAMLDLRIWRRSPAAIAAALVPPLAMGLMLWVLTLAVGRQPVALVQLSHGRYADHMAGILRDESDAYEVFATDAAGARRLIASQQAAAVITIPADFDAAVAARPPLLPSEGFSDTRQDTATTPEAQVLLTVNNVDIDFSDDIRRTVDRSVAQFDAPDVIIPSSENSLDMSELNPFRTSIWETELRTTTVDYFSYSIIPIFVLLALSVGVMGTALLCAQDIERGTARYLALSPQRPSTLVIGRLLGGFLASAIILAPFFVVATVTGMISPPLGHWPALAALFVATLLCAGGLGAMLGATLRGARIVSMAASVLCTYLFFLGGGFTTIQFLPDWLRTLTAFVPVRYAIDGLRQALFYPGLEGLRNDLVVLVATAVVAVVAGAFFVRRAWSR